jgi:hypothetical protein
MGLLNLRKVGLQEVLDTLGQHGNAVLITFGIADDQLRLGKVDIFRLGGAILL